MNSEILAEAMQKRLTKFDKEDFDKRSNIVKTLLQETELLQMQRNQISKKIGVLKKERQDCTKEMQDIQDINIKLDKNKNKLLVEKGKLDEILLDLPNILDSRVPLGKEESENKVISTWSKPKTFDFPVKDHVDLGENIGINFEKAAENSKSRFVYLTDISAKLHRALTQWMLDVHVHKHGYTEAYVPLLVNKQALTNTGQLPKFAEDLFFTEDGFGLIPTSEVSLVGMYANEQINIKDLPIKLVAHSPCFRSEAGSYGKDTRGMIRQHQFDKVELVQIVHPNDSERAHQEILANAESILQQLNLPYRTILKCSGDTGFTASITYDLEVWLPSQNTYREISSISQCTDFQAKRMKCRFKGGSEKGYVHTLNGSGLAVGRTLVAVIENYQQSDGSIEIPEVLKPYLQFRD